MIKKLIEEITKINKQKEKLEKDKISGKEYEPLIMKALIEDYEIARSVRLEQLKRYSDALCNELKMGSLTTNDKNTKSEIQAILKAADFE